MDHHRPPLPRFNRGMYQRLSALLERYVSKIMAQSLLRRALSDQGIAGGTLDARALEQIFDQLMVGLRLFCDAERLPEAMALVTEFCLAQGAFVNPRPRYRDSSSSLRSVSFR